MTIKFIKQINLGVILIALLTFILGWQLGHKDIDIKWQQYKPTVKVENKEPPKNVNVDFKLFWDTWDLLSREYLDKKAIDPQKMFYGAISGMVAAVGDPYTVFLPPDSQKSTKEELNGSFEGVGIQLGFNKEKRLVVVAPLEGTPAEAAGIKPEDIIVKIDENEAQALTLPQAVNLIRGPKGTQVKLTIFRDGEEDTRSFTLTRDTIIVKSVTLKQEKTKSGKNIAVIKLSRFGERTEDEWNEVVSQVLAGSPQGLILDLRNNPGGFLEGAVFIASEFLPEGETVVMQDGKGGKAAFKVQRAGKLLKLPLTVLINKGSASASEIVAGALKDNNRAKLIGEKSFGKGTIQEAEDLPGGTGIHITTAKWLTPKNTWVNETDGLEPDIKIEPEKSKDGEDKVDTQLDRALEALD